MFVNIQKYKTPKSLFLSLLLLEIPPCKQLQNMASCKDNDIHSKLIQSLIDSNTSKSLVATPPTLTERAKIEKEIINSIIRGKPESLMPNSGQSISIGDHYVCVSYHVDTELDCRVWEWHGHLVSYCEVGGGYTKEYVTGSYFERLMTNVSRHDTIEEEIVEEEEEDTEEEMGIEWGLSGFFGGMNLMDRRRDFWRNRSGDSRRRY